MSEQTSALIGETAFSEIDNIANISGLSGIAITGRNGANVAGIPDGSDRVRPGLPCAPGVASRLLGNIALESLPPGFVRVGDVVPLVLADLSATTGVGGLEVGRLDYTTAARLIHDFPVPGSGENGPRSEQSSSESEPGTDQEIVSKSRIETALHPTIRIDLVARKVSKFAKMLDSMPLSLRNEDARQGLRLELVEYRDRLSFLLESSCLVTSDATPVNGHSITSSNIPDSPLYLGKSAVCNIK